jgi:hypothetical protein
MYLGSEREQSSESLEALVEPLAPPPLRDHVVELAAGGLRRLRGGDVLLPARRGELPVAHCHVHAHHERDGRLDHPLRRCAGPRPCSRRESRAVRLERPAPRRRALRLTAVAGQPRRRKRRLGDGRRRRGGGDDREHCPRHRGVLGLGSRERRVAVDRRQQAGQLQRLVVGGRRFGGGRRRHGADQRGVLGAPDGEGRQRGRRRPRRRHLHHLLQQRLLHVVGHRRRRGVRRQPDLHLPAVAAHEHRHLHHHVEFDQCYKPHFCNASSPSIKKRTFVPASCLSSTTIQKGQYRSN